MDGCPLCRAMRQAIRMCMNDIIGGSPCWNKLLGPFEAYCGLLTCRLTNCFLERRKIIDFFTVVMVVQLGHHGRDEVTLLVAPGRGRLKRIQVLLHLLCTKMHY